MEFASFKHVYIIALSVKPRKLEKGLEFARIIQYSAVAQPRRFGRGADRIVGFGLLAKVGRRQTNGFKLEKFSYFSNTTLTTIRFANGKLKAGQC